MDILCTVDIATREVSLPEEYVIASYDHLVDVIHFYIEPIEDFSLDTSSIRIAAQGPDGTRHDYAVDSTTVSVEEETGYIAFDWPIPAGVTEMPIGAGFKYGDRGQLIFAVCAEIIDGSTVSKAWHSDDGIITVVAHLEPESGGGEDPSEEATNAQKIGQLQTDVAVINTQVGALGNGSPSPVATVAEMTDESAVYLYTGSESGYTAGNWYYYDGSAWTSGGTYGGAVTDTTLSISGKPADAKAVGDALALKADTADINALENDVTSIEEALFKTIDHNKSVTVPVAVGDYKNTADLLAIDIPAGQAFTIRLSTDATHGNLTIYANYSDNTYSALTYNATFDTDLTYTKDKEIVLFGVQVSGGFTSTGTFSFSVSYTTNTENSIEEKIESIEGGIVEVQNGLDAIYHDYIKEVGYNLIAEWVSGDIDSNGNEISSGSYYRTNRVNVDASKTYYLAQVTSDSEGTTKVSAWGNNTYGIIHCYSDSAYLGVATDGTGNNAGIFTPLANTTKVCISHVYQNSTTIHMYELNSEDDRQSITPTGHDDVYEKSFDSASMTRTKVSSEQIDFTANDGTTLVTKETASPWFVWSSYLISDYIPFDSGTYYIKCVISGMTGMYIRIYDENKEQISYVSLGSYQTPTKFYAPNGTKYIKVSVGKSTPKLSDLTTMEIYTFASRSIGYTPMHDVIDVNVLPVLPPTATTGKSGSGIICLGHGGLSSVYAEDSIESFYGLAHCGFDGSEVDIQFTKDNVPVCWHDGSLSTLDGGTSNDHIWDYTLAELDANFDFRTWWDKRDCFRSTVARFEEFCILARAYGWYIMPDKCLGPEADRATNMQAVIDLVNKYGIQDKFIPAHSFTEFCEAFPNNMFSLTAMQTAVDETWINGLLNNVIPDLCHQDGQGNMIVNDGVEVTTGFNWQAIKEANGVQKCAEITELMVAHNVKPNWYLCETPEDIYQLVKYCPKTAFLLTGLYTVPDGVNAYLGIGRGNNRFDLSRDVHL